MNLEERIAEMETSISSLTNSLERMEDRISQLEQLDPAAIDNPEPEIEAVDVTKDLDSVEEPSSNILVFLGRSFLVLAGAFVLRTLTDSGTLNQQLGVTLGLLYAFAGLILSDRLGAQGKKTNATFHGCTAIIIAYPLVFETTVKLEIISPVLSCVILSILTGVALIISWRRHLRVLAIAFTLAALGTSIPILLSTGAIQSYCIFLILLGCMTIWFRHTRNWNVMCWIVALVANIMVLILVSLASDPADLNTRFGHITVQGAQIIALGLFFAYLGAFVIRTILFRYPVKTFTIFQSSMVILIGLGGAIHISPSTGGLAKMTLGPSALIFSLAFYALAALFLDRQQQERRNFHYFIWLGQILLFIGSWLTLGTSTLLVVWSILAIATAYFGGKYHRVSLRLQSVLYATFSFWRAGIFKSSYEAFTDLAQYPWGLHNVGGLTVLVLVIVTYIVIIRTQETRVAKPWKNVIRFVLLLYCLMGIATVVIALLVQAVGNGIQTNPALVAVIRTAVLACSAILMAAIGKRNWYAELKWMVYPVLILGAIKLLLEDLHIGDTGLLSLSFIFYGLALILVPRLLKNKDSNIQDGTA